MLVGHHPQTVALGGQAQHGFHEVTTVLTHHPAGAKHQVPAAGLPHGVLARQLGLAIDRQRSSGVGFLVGLRALPGKHIVGREMHQAGAYGLRFFGHHARGHSVDAMRQIGLALRFVHGGVSRGIEDDVGAMGSDGGANRVGGGQVDGLAVEDDELFEGEVLAESPAQLAVAPEQQHALA